MANRERGDVELRMAGKTFTLNIGLNAMALVEDLFSKPGHVVTWDYVFGPGLESGSILYIRGVLWAALQKHHPGLTVDHVGDLIEQEGLTRFEATLKGALIRAGLFTIPDKADLEELGVSDNGRNPPGAQADGTGERFDSKPGASA